MKQTRQNVFETNSSSTHSICIAKDVQLTLPETVNFCFGEFGWEIDTLYSTNEKASYLYTGLIACDRNDDMDNIVTLLKNKGINVNLETLENQNVYSYDQGYVDHSYELLDFLNAITTNEDMLLSYLFSDLSFIITGNDNDDKDVNINVTYPHDEFYKGN